MTQTSIIDPEAPRAEQSPSSVLPTPEHVTWAEVKAKTAFPPTWELVGHPYPVPRGALIITRFTAKRVGRRLSQVLSWNMVTGQLDVLTEAGTRAIFSKASDARDVAERISAGLRAAVQS